MQSGINCLRYLHFFQKKVFIKLNKSLQLLFGKDCTGENNSSKSLLAKCLTRLKTFIDGSLTLLCVKHLILLYILRNVSFLSQPTDQHCETLHFCDLRKGLLYTSIAQKTRF